MAKLKQVVIGEIYNKLDNNYFSLPDFDVQFPDEGKLYVQIKFRHDPKYFFGISEEVESGSGFAALALQVERKLKPHTQESPGDFKAIEWKVHGTFDSAIDRIGPWCKNLQQELRAKSPVVLELEELRKKLEEHLSIHEIENPEAHFTEQEIQRLSEKFDSLQARISDLEAQHKITKQELDLATADITIIKENATTLPKGIWSKLAQSRLVSLVSKIASSPEAKKLMLDVAEHALISHDTIPKP